jgi:hypothetical protein
MGFSLAREQIEHVELTKPKRAGGRWKGVKHRDLDDMIRRKLAEQGYSAPTVSYAMNNNQTQLSACYLLDWHLKAGNTIYQVGVGVMSDNAMRSRCRFFPFVIDAGFNKEPTLVVLGSVTLPVLLTTKANIEEAIGIAVAGCLLHLKQIAPRIIADLLGTTCEKDECSRLLLDFARANAIPFSKLREVETERQQRPLDSRKWYLLRCVCKVIHEHCPEHNQLERMAQVLSILTKRKR